MFQNANIRLSLDSIAAKFEKRGEINTDYAYKAANMIPAVLGVGAGVPFPNLTGIQLFDLVRDLGNPNDAIDWAMRHGLLAGTRDCRHCPGQVAMVLEVCNEGDGKRWRCPTQGCRSTMSIRKGSFYSQCKLPLKDCIMITFFWSYNDVSQATVGAWLNVDTKRTLPDWFNMHRDLCIDWMQAHPKQVGGPGRVVQIDESLVASAKTAANRRARPVPERWVFGGIDTTTSEAFMVEVPRRDAATLLPIIQQRILPGTTVWSDQWAAYRRLTAATGLQHDTVNHSVTFVDPGTGVNTNTVENLWKNAKDKMKRMHGTCKAHIASYLDEFMWHREFGARDVCFQNAVAIMRWRYPLP